jgi:hypothetical protein
MANYDRRVVARSVPDLESVIGDWMKNAAPILLKDIVVQARLPGSGTRQSVHWQPDGCLIDVSTFVPFNGNGHEQPGASVGAQIHIEWFVTAGQEFDAGVTVSFHGGGKAHKDWRFGWNQDPGEQGVVIGTWIRSLEPVAPPEN